MVRIENGPVQHFCELMGLKDFDPRDFTEDHTLAVAVLATGEALLEELQLIRDALNERNRLLAAGRRARTAN